MLISDNSVMWLARESILQYRPLWMSSESHWLVKFKIFGDFRFLFIDLDSPKIFNLYIVFGKFLGFFGTTQLWNLPFYHQEILTDCLNSSVLNFSTLPLYHLVFDYSAIFRNKIVGRSLILRVLICRFIFWSAVIWSDAEYWKYYSP